MLFLAILPSPHHSPPHLPRLRCAIPHSKLQARRGSRRRPLQQPTVVFPLPTEPSKREGALPRRRQQLPATPPPRRARGAGGAAAMTMTSPSSSPTLRRRLASRPLLPRLRPAAAAGAAGAAVVEAAEVAGAGEERTSPEMMLRMALFSLRQGAQAAQLLSMTTGEETAPPSSWPCWQLFRSRSLGCCTASGESGATVGVAWTLEPSSCRKNVDCCCVSHHSAVGFGRCADASSVSSSSVTAKVSFPCTLWP